MQDIKVGVHRPDSPETVAFTEVALGDLFYIPNTPGVYLKVSHSFAWHLGHHGARTVSDLTRVIPLEPGVTVTLEVQ